MLEPHNVSNLVDVTHHANGKGDTSQTEFVPPLEAEEEAPDKFHARLVAHETSLGVRAETSGSGTDYGLIPFQGVGNPSDTSGNAPTDVVDLPTEDDSVTPPMPMPASPVEGNPLLEGFYGLVNQLKPAVESFIVGAILAAFAAIYQQIFSGQALSYNTLLAAVGGALLDYATSKMRQWKATHEEAKASAAFARNQFLQSRVNTLNYQVRAHGSQLKKPGTAL